MNINLHIERLMLDGFDIAPEQRTALQIAVEGELSRLLTERGFSPSLAQGTSVPRLSAQDMRDIAAFLAAQPGPLTIKR